MGAQKIGQIAEGVLCLVGLYNWMDFAVLRLTLLPLGRVSDTVRGAIPSPAIAQRRLFSRDLGLVVGKGLSCV